MWQVSKVTVVFLCFISTYLYVHGANVLKTTDLKETNNLLSSADGKVSEVECDKDSDCENTLNCVQLGTRKPKACVKCDCPSSHTCLINELGKSECRCPAGQVERDEDGKKTCLMECEMDTDCEDTLNCVQLGTGKPKACVKCDCGPYGLCEFEGGQKKCKCAPLSIEFKGKCLECDCGKFSKSCSYNTNGAKICDCKSDYVDADGLCTECDCGVHGLCKIESGQKKCICSPSYVEVNGKCLACDCGEATYTCDLDSSGKKLCKCKGGYKENNGYCAECYCGRSGTCSYVNGERRCMCDLYYSERNGTCEFCSCGENSNSCYFDSKLDKRCRCPSRYAEKDGRCEECDCGRYGSCIFENGRKRCKCNSFTVEKYGMCITMSTTTDPPTPTTAAILTSTTQDCDCGENSTSCHFNWHGDKICECAPGYSPFSGFCYACDCGKNSIDCHLNMEGENICGCRCGYLQNNGYCEECNCGPYGGCTFENGRKKCICMPFAVEVNGVCVDFGTTSEGTTDSTITSTFASSTVQECDCGSRGRCTFEKGQKKCICDPFTSVKDGKCVDCYCGENSKSCHFNWNGDKICNCTSGYSQVYGFCFECNCGINAQSCFYRKDGAKVCNCNFGYTQTNGHCSAICSEDKCLHGICEIVENDFKCRCDEGFTGKHCEEKIPIKPNKKDLWLLLILSVTFAIFMLLSGMFCFWTRYLSKISKK